MIVGTARYAKLVGVAVVALLWKGNVGMAIQTARVRQHRCHLAECLLALRSPVVFDRSALNDLRGHGDGYTDAE